MPDLSFPAIHNLCARMRRHFPVFAALQALLVSAPLAAAEPPKVVATIKPLHALAAGVMAGAGAPVLLLERNESPHTFSLRPSQAAALDSADLVIWVGPELESGLTKAIESLAHDAVKIQLSAIAGIDPLALREGGVWEAHAHNDAGAENDHGHGHGAHDDDGHGDAAHEPDGTYNMHVWLDPIRMKVYVAALAETLSELDSSRAPLYRSNAVRVAQELDALDSELSRNLVPVRDRPFIVFHDAFQYFEVRYGLTAAGSITLSPDRSPGPKRLYEIRNAIVERNVACVFAEPQFPAPIVDSVIEGTPARRGSADPLGLAVDSGPEAYAAILRDVARSMRDCLGRQ